MLLVTVSSVRLTGLSTHEQLHVRLAFAFKAHIGGLTPGCAVLLPYLLMAFAKYIAKGPLLSFALPPID